MTDLVFYDASVPPPHEPQADGVAFYIGGDTPHVWTRAEIEATTVRYRLPIYVRSTPQGANALADAAEALQALAGIGAPKGCIVAWDTETSASVSYMAAIYVLIKAAGYRLMDYGSQSDLFQNEMPGDGYYWGADWTGTEHIDPGDAGTQYANDGGYDLSVFKPGLPFWDTRGGAVPPSPANWQEHMMQQLPILRQGMTGEPVKTVQGLCGARGWPVAVDGIFGPATVHAVHLVQDHAGITSDGIVGQETWPALLGI